MSSAKGPGTTGFNCFTNIACCSCAPRVAREDMPREREAWGTENFNSAIDTLQLIPCNCKKLQIYWKQWNFYGFDSRIVVAPCELFCEIIVS